MNRAVSKDLDLKAQDVASNYSMNNGNTVGNKRSLEDAEILAALQCYVPGTVEEKRLVRKADMVLLPLLWWMYILAYLDRGNIANANAAGLSEDLGLSNNQYSLLVSIFFVAYVLFEVPSNMLLMKIKPSIYLPTICVVWGSVIIGMSQSKTASSFLAGRFFLGMIEAGLFPGALFLLTCWYTKKEVGKRFCIFYTSGCVAPALGGIMAGAVISRLEGARGISGWRWLLLIEGVVTVACGFGLYFVLPDYPRNSKLLTHEQRLLGHVRILHDQSASVQSEDDGLTPIQAFAAVLKDGRTWIFLVLYACNILGLTISYFIPTMLKGLGYTSITAQWMTVPIWACGAVFQLLWSWTSDKYQDRRWHITGLLSISALSCLIAIVVRNNIVKYVMMCFLIGGMFTTVPLILNWTSEVMAKPERKRSIAIAFVNSFGHTSYIYGSYLWPASEGPRNLKGFAASNAVLGTAAILAAALPIIFKYLRTRDREPVGQRNQ
ncbi:major facilitator superfamily domain-containing protein [Colletotrichum godetiae]|uniref:Major facilitator superfamily domain-containing protein n=1 Tax=Colletotrichum godetiae TaxID=1209918 RepID=A0AAJ0A8Y2_9PEZI|nr:major facilitator superfamily domain-containing protein [Colletotrichum godetiae]KAK1656710.1 major facilitator superfamily domain-containing protein [Colletotrichum godetiae]